MHFISKLLQFLYLGLELELLVNVLQLQQLPADGVGVGLDDGDFFEEIIEKRPVRRLVARLPRLNVLRRRGLCSTVLRRDFGLDLDTAAKTAEEARALEKTGPKEERRHFERVP